ncbi:flagellar hook-basal body protein [Dethiobacter alkaliphilus]|uniref:flagellar hook-basal body protein n=1 Tax=Dethiobacter alkaliphilus TaxID=427926 RepID=UPI002227A677|nr:flagellar hook-basal body protein [Dethiobacter alkaliphilus]MCW3488722.1 flagellar hook-basal body protein [Dethiobacter alkaliphilus]
MTIRGLWNAAGGMRAQQQKIDVTAHNIANVNTTGYKKKTTLFSDLVYQSIERRGNAVEPAAAGEHPKTVGVGSKVAAIRSDLRPGTYLQTDRDLDMAIVGDGYFQITLPGGGMAYTRDGSFSRDSEGNIVNSQGYRVVFPQLPEGQYELNVAPEGAVSAVYEDGTAVPLGMLQLAYFDNPHGLEQLGDNLLQATPASGAALLAFPGEGSRVSQGYLESSNVDLAEELTQMIINQRSFELNSRALRTAEEMWSIANQLYR